MGSQNSKIENAASKSKAQDELQHLSDSMNNTVNDGRRIATGIIVTYGYCREYQKNNLNTNIPNGLINICAHFLDIYLSWFLSKDKKHKIIAINHEYHSTKKISLVNNRWDDLNKFEKRLLMDIIILNKKLFITEIECNSINFGINGCIWLSSFLSYCNNINYINLSNCNLDNNSIKLISQSLLKNKYNKNLLLSTKYYVYAWIYKIDKNINK